MGSEGWKAEFTTEAKKNNFINTARKSFFYVVAHGEYNPILELNEMGGGASMDPENIIAPEGETSALADFLGIHSGEYTGAKNANNKSFHLQPSTRGIPPLMCKEISQIDIEGTFDIEGLELIDDGWTDVIETTQKEDVLQDIEAWAENRKQKVIPTVDEIGTKSKPIGHPRGTIRRDYPSVFKLKSNQYIYGTIPNVYTRVQDEPGEEDEMSIFKNRPVEELIDIIANNNVKIGDEGRGKEPIPGMLIRNKKPVLYKPGDIVPNITISLYIENKDGDGNMGIWFLCPTTDQSDDGINRLNKKSLIFTDDLLKQKFLKHLLGVVSHPNYFPVLNMKIPLSVLCDILIPSASSGGKRKRSGIEGGGVIFLPLCFPIRPRLINPRTGSNIFLPVTYDGRIQNVHKSITSLIEEFQYRTKAAFHQPSLSYVETEGDFIWNVSSDGDGDDYSDRHLQRTRGNITRLEEATRSESIEAYKSLIDSLIKNLRILKPYVDDRELRLQIRRYLRILHEMNDKNIIKKKSDTVLELITGVSSFIDEHLDVSRIPRQALLESTSSIRPTKKSFKKISLRKKRKSKQRSKQRSQKRKSKQKNNSRRKSQRTSRRKSQRTSRRTSRRRSRRKSVRRKSRRKSKNKKSKY